MGSPGRRVEDAVKVAMPSLREMRPSQRASCGDRTGNGQNLLCKLAGITGFAGRILSFRHKSESPLEALDVAGPNVGVDNARRPFAVERLEKLLGGDLAHVRPGFGSLRRVRAREHIIELHSGWSGGGGSFDADRPGPRPRSIVAQRREQRGFIVDKTPRRRDK